MTSEGSEMRARTTTPASLVQSEGRHSSISNRDTHEEVLIKDLRKPDVTTDLLAERTFLTDCLPVDVLQAVVHKPAPTKNLGPGNERMDVKDVLPELEGPPQFIATERKRDVSFLGDVQALPQIEEKPSKLDPSAIRYLYQESLKPPKKAPVIPESKIPVEYHMSKNKAVLGLEYDGNEPKDIKEREQGLIIFPSQRPSKREEVVFLRDTMDAMLKKAKIDTEIEVTGTSQMKKMMQNVKKEQEVFDVIFNELIRQTMVDNADRAEILQSLRQRYNKLVDKVPVEVQSLHDEVLAQRSLDKKLTEELMRFKTTIGVLTGELADIRQHDQRVSNQAQKAEDELNAALDESKRNAELLEEYHALYELQRKRLEQSVATNNEEKETWSAAAYCLALKVTDEGRLNTAKRLHVAAKAWTQLASHFTLMLSDLDTEQLTEMHTTVGKWRDDMEIVSSDLIQREKRSKDSLMTLRAKMDGFRTVYEQKYVVDGKLVNIPDPDKRPNIMDCVVDWQNILMDEIEHFRSSDVSGIFDRLVNSERCADEWTQKANGLFKRHNLDEGNPEWNKLNTMNERVNHLSETVRSHLSGDNGLLEITGQVLSGIAEWLVRCAPMLEVQENVDDEEWYALDELVNVSIDDLDKVINLIEEGQAAVVPEVLQKAYAWMTELASGIDKMDVDMMDTVGVLHRAMVDWMVQTLLLLAPPRQDVKEGEAEPKDATEEEKEVRKEAEELFEKVDAFSRHVTKCCWDIVEAVERKRFEMTAAAVEADGLELKRLQKESDEWVLSAKLLLRELYGGEIQLDRSDTQAESEVESKKDSSGTEKEKEPEPVEMNVTIPPAPDDEEEDNLKEAVGEEEPEEPENNENVDPDGTSNDNTEVSYEALAALATLKVQYKEAFDRANQATSSHQQAKTELETAREELRTLEEEMAEVAAKLAEIKSRPAEPEKRPALLREGSSPRPMAALQTDAAAARRQAAVAAANADSSSGLTTPATPSQPPGSSTARTTPRGTGSRGHGEKKGTEGHKKTGGGRHRKK